MHHAQQSKIPLAIFKADIQKAFDTISWDFIIATLQARGLSENWPKRIANSVLKGYSQVIIKGVLGKNIVLKRGVPQGDPLSPYLFILATDFISRWCTKLQQTAALSSPFVGVRLCILYADDLLFILNPIVRNMQVLKLMLQFWEIISGLAINLRKSEIATVAETEENTTRFVETLNCKVTSFPMKYLGLPLSFEALFRSDYLPLMINTVQN